MPYSPPPLRPHPAAEPLTGPADALSVVFAAASDPPRAEAICLLLDHAHRGLGCIVVVGAGPLEPVVEMLEHLACTEPTIEGVVLASVRTGDADRAGRGDLLAFHDLRERFDVLGIDLVDWFVVHERHAASLAELTDSQVRWRARR